VISTTPARSIEAAVIHHVLNRGNARMSLFRKDSRYAEN
jgi:hypothetical protein